MSLFGQVWLWSLLAFVIGVLLTWFVLVLPARNHVRELESRLAQAHAQASRSAEPMVPTNTAYLSQPAVFEQEPYIRQESYAQPEQYEAGEQYAQAEEQPEQEHNRHVAAEPEVAAWAEGPVAEYEARLEPDREPDPGDFHPATEYLQYVERELSVEPLSVEPEHEPSLFQPEPALADFHPDPDWFELEVVPERSPFEEPPGSEPVKETEVTQVVSAYEFDQDGEEQGEQPVVPDLPADATQVLPKRQPRQSPLGGLDAPRSIQPSMRAIERRELNSDLSGVQSGSLFEPSVEPGMYGRPLAPEPPPARDAMPVDSAPPGPFGPGSAMPRPGGGRPSDDFTVKASVTALRYCTDESSQFQRMVAEVWFHTPEDAERVGFHPLM
jgi:hypothetical protein